ncbi:MAG: protein-methionine-sulfoxide reductase catalytic subunit MsrP [Vulcanimicrobiota bacterium]
MKAQPPTEKDVTPQEVYLKRRALLKAVGIGVISMGLGGLLSQVKSSDTVGIKAGGSDEFGNPVNPMNHATGFTNYYDVSVDKRRVQELAQRIRTDEWTLSVGGAVHKPITYNLDDIAKKFPSRQEICRMRCVEAWSVVLPWDGFPLGDLLNASEPMGSAKFVRFESKLDPTQFVGQLNKAYPWPYFEALRMDEAMHPLCMMAVGMYGQPLPKVNGAPIRLVVPWKYGFKSAKAVIKIELTEEQPQTFWNVTNPAAYGFWANVNPDVHHPNWSQASEYRLGFKEKIPTLLFNGYGHQVAHMYKGMDLRALY